jgi:hypothetical protein
MLNVHQMSGLENIPGQADRLPATLISMCIPFNDFCFPGVDHC